jgi:hypothetical protein
MQARLFEVFKMFRIHCETTNFYRTFGTVTELTNFATVWKVGGNY